MSKADNIVLIGMPGAGKSTIGAKLAQKLNWEFLDTDDVILDMTNIPLEQTLEESGLYGFLDTEKDAILTIDCTKTVIATGGSVILRRESMTHLKKLGRIYYLRLPFCTISRRIKNFETRGIARHKNQTLWSIYKTRIPLYEKYCDVKINCNKKHIDKIVNKIICEFNEE